MKWLETPSVYHIKKDELYELDAESFDFLKTCSSEKGCPPEVSEEFEGSEISGFIDYCVEEGILTSSGPSGKRPPVVKSPEPSLRYLELQITDRCNLRCGHCYIGDGNRSELSPDRIRAILTQFEEIQGLRLLLTGGEPLLHSRFAEVNAMLPEFYFRKALFTNGLLLREERIKDLNVDEIQISIDGLEEAHELIRGKGSFGPAMAAIKFCIAAGFEVSVSTMVHAGNLGDFEAMDRLFREIGVRDWTVDVPCITGRLKENSRFQLTPEQAGKYLGYGFGGGLHSGAAGFGCGLHLMSVSADGRAAKCTFYSARPAGMIEEGLRTCFSRITPVRLDSLKCDCKQIESCRAGCRYRAEILGDSLGKDLYRCVLYDTI